MTVAIPRVRMIAGPNGSGKSTVKSLLDPALLGVYVNPDLLEAELREQSAINLQPFGIATNQDEAKAFLGGSELLIRAGLQKDVEAVQLNAGRLEWVGLLPNSYHASVVADFIRRKLLEANRSFSFETVMSSRDKVELMKAARGRSFRTYLYYVATEDPNINIGRVRYRVRHGGHNVPEDKIESRYFRSLDLLFDAIQCTNRAFIFDNSGDHLDWVAEITDGKLLEMKTSTMPSWFKQSVWGKFQGA